MSQNLIGAAVSLYQNCNWFFSQKRRAQKFSWNCHQEYRYSLRSSTFIIYLLKIWHMIAYYSINKACTEDFWKLDRALREVIND